MKTFEIEYKELLLWLKAENERLAGRRISWEGGYDGEKAFLERQIWDAYRNRLRELKEKYSD